MSQETKTRDGSRVPYPGILVTRIFSEYREEEHGSFLQQLCRRQMAKPRYPKPREGWAHSHLATERGKGKKKAHRAEPIIPTSTLHTHTCTDVHLHKPQPGHV